MAIHQDKLGRMWFGTEEGLNRYDGLGVTAYKPVHSVDSEDPIIGNMTNYVTSDKQGDIYFNSDHSFVKYSLQTEQFQRIRKDSVRAVCSSNDGVGVGVSDTSNDWNEDLSEGDWLTCFIPEEKVFDILVE